MTYEEAMDIGLGIVDQLRFGSNGRNQAMEKQISKKPLFEGDGYWRGELVYDTWICPNCDTDYEVGTDTHKYCPNCGQAIDWSEEE